MENNIRFQSEQSLNGDALFLASHILLEVHRVIRNIQTVVAVLLRYALVGVSITSSLIELVVPTAAEEAAH
jgi:hypothetical protein